MKKITLLLILILLITVGCKEDEQPPETPPITTDYDIDYSIRFGVGAHIYPRNYNSVQDIYAATKDVDKLGYVWLRHPGAGIAWYEIQPTKDTWNFEKLDAVIKNNKHPWIYPMYGMVGNVYPFGGFSKEELESNSGVKADVINYITSHNMDLTDPQQKEDAEEFVKTVVERYKDTIEYWEIGGNEGLPAPEKYDIIYNTYIWIKEADPNAKVLITANCGDGDWTFYDNIDALDSILSKGATQSFDIANFHYYGYMGGDNGDNFEETLEERYDEYKAVLDKHNINKPIWVTETGTCSDEGSQISPGGNELLQAQHAVKRLAIYAAKGAEKVFWYSYGPHSPNDLFNGCELVDHSGPKPAYYNFKLMVDKVGHYNSVKKIRGDNVWLFEFTNDNNKVYIAWARAPETIDFRQYINKPEVLVTHIIEDSSTTHDTETLTVNSIELTESPIIIE